jgi:hypothetical protein
VARDRVRAELFREDDADLRPERERADAPRLDVLRELLDLVLAFFLPRPVDFFVAAIAILSLSCHRVRTSQRRTQCESDNSRKVVRKRCTFKFIGSTRHDENATRLKR